MNLRLFLFGFLLICIPLFRQDFFVRHSSIFYLYFTAFPIGLTVMLRALSRRRGRFGIMLGACVLAEIFLVGSVAYMSVFKKFDPLPESYYYWIRGQYSYFKNTTNFNSELSRYDSLLTYRFRPGITGRFTNPEFNVEIKTNSLGVRDDEASLQFPAIVVLGDSHGMGWGVDQDRRFSEVIEKKLHVNVLNTAITSYGTHRETRLLDEVNLDSCKLLIIQYCENDLEENRANLLEPQRLGMNAFAFDIAERQNSINKTYFPFKGLFLGIRWIITSGFGTFQSGAKTATQAAKVKTPDQEHAKAFFPYLNRIRKRFQGPILVFDLGVYNYPIVKEFQLYQAAHPVKNVYFMNVHSLLTRGDYFTIDDHINDRGHAKIGLALDRLIQERNWLGRRCR